MKLFRKILVAMLLGTMAIQVAWSNKADVNAKDKFGETVLMDAVGRSLNTVKYLVENGADMNAQVSSGLFPGWTALMFAAHRESYESVKYLVSKGADINIVNGNGQNALMIALMESYYASQRIAIAKHLIFKGININVKDDEGKTALMYATKRCWIDVVKLLVKKGADINAEDDEGATALSYVSDCYLVEKFLQSKGAKYGEGRKQMCSVDGKNIELLRAAAVGNASQLKESIKLGADVNAKTVYCNTVLMETIRNSRKIVGGLGEIIELLVENGADVNAKDNEGKTALMYARSLEVVKYLLSKGADINAKDNNGKSVLDYTRSGEVAEFLISNGAKK